MSMIATMQNIERDTLLKLAIISRFFRKSVMRNENLKLIKTNKSLHVFFEMMAHFVGNDNQYKFQKEKMRGFALSRSNFENCFRI